MSGAWREKELTVVKVVTLECCLVVERKLLVALKVGWTEGITVDW